MRFKEFIEMHHAYDNIDWDTKFNPIKKGDTLRVFHGFNSFKDAYSAAVYGLSGRSFADRRYSYESDNNPYGLFITLDLKTATKFTSAVQDEVIMEFNAREEDLESPVWPGGSFTVQGQMSQYFGHWPKGKRKRQQAHKEAEKEWEKTANDRKLTHIQQSDNKHKAAILTHSGEYQALFIGDLNPQDIAAFHIRPLPYNYDNPWQRLTREEFIEKYKEKYEDYKPGGYKLEPEHKVFLPAEEFEPNKFVQGMMKRFDNSQEEMMDSLKTIWQLITRKTNRGNWMSSMESYLGHHLYPKQMIPAFKWLKSTFGRR
jgi:hypothetical protein